MIATILDVIRALTIFALGAALMLELAMLQYMMAVMHFPGGLTVLFTKRATQMRAISRAAGVGFIAVELHDRFGDPFSWRIPVAVLIAATSLGASLIPLLSRESRIEPPE